MPSKNQSVLKEKSCVGRQTCLAGGRFYRLLECALINVQCRFLHKKQEDSSDKCRDSKLLGEGRTYVAARQNESKLGDTASIDFQDKLFLT